MLIMRSDRFEKYILWEVPLVKNVHSAKCTILGECLFCEVRILRQIPRQWTGSLMRYIALRWFELVKKTAPDYEYANGPGIKQFKELFSTNVKTEL
jgi:hypothetical protein